MATVKFTALLQRFYPDLTALEMEAGDVANLLQQLNDRYPKFKGYITDEQGRLRKHVNIFVNGKMIRDREALSDALNTTDEVFILQALSGG